MVSFHMKKSYGAADFLDNVIDMLWQFLSAV